MKKLAIALLFAGFVPSAKSQVTTYLIDYTNENFTHPCNIFNSNPSSTVVDGYQHQSTIGNVLFDAGLKAVVLQCHASDAAHSYGTQYQVNFPFKKNYRYKVRVMFKGEKNSTTPESFPMLGIKLQVTKLAPNYTLNCIGPQREYQDMTGREYGGASFVWSNYLISTDALSVDYQSVSILGTSANSGSTGDQSIKIQKVEITEEAPAAPVNYAKKIKLLGLDTTEMINTGGYIIAEKDILFAKSFLDTLKEQTIADKNIQGTATFTDSNIKIYVTPGNYFYVDASLDALARWNEIQNSGLNFYRFTNQDQVYDWDIRPSNNLPVFAASDFPGYPQSNGIEGYNILVNDDAMRQQPNFYWSSATKYLIHTIGHLIGVRHPDFHGTMPDPASIFNSTFSATNNGLMVQSDENIVQSLYPFQGCNLLGLVSISNVIQSGQLYFTNGSAYTAKPGTMVNIEVEIIGISDPAYYYHYSDTPEEYSLPALPPGQYTFKIRYLNSKNCISSWGQKTITVN